MIELKYDSEKDGVRASQTVWIDDADKGWDDILESMLHFLFNTGYIVDKCLIDKMVDACEEIHQDSLEQTTHQRVGEEGQGDGTFHSKWIPWSGKSIPPVEYGVYVDVIFRDGEEHHRLPNEVGLPHNDVSLYHECWEHSGNNDGGEVMFYRVCE